MLLKTLSLAGFKSFADRTRLTFGSGVNVVVGPNGSGKSNLLDALAWVMGTQATRTLRTQRMEDVIFAGTTSRPSLGRAEVSLTFDNTDSFLPLDLAEVTLTRRLYRDGTSDYALNGTACRLLDIQDLLSDGGVGRQQHVLVGQGEIGTILSARPDQHRAVIEEAAGVTKHRSRRDRAVRRLEQTDIDLARLGDILDQERRRLRPLKRQANAADRHDDFRARVRALRLWLGGRQLAGIRERLASAQMEREALEATSTQAAAELARVETDLVALREAAGEVGRALERDTAAAARLETLGERFQRIAMVARERRVGIEDRLRGADERKRDLDAERTHLIGELERVAELERTAAIEVDRLTTAYDDLEAEERVLADQVRLPAEGLLASLRGDLRSLEVASERDDREHDQLDRRIELVTARSSDEAGKTAELVDHIRSADAELSRARDGYDAVRSEREQAQEAWEGAEADHRDHSLTLAAAHARRGAIEEALAGAGDPEATRRVGAAAGVLGPVTSRLDAPLELAAAVDAALGRWSAGFVTGGAGDTKAVAAMLKGEGLGGVTLISGRGGDAEDAQVARAVAAQWGLDALVDLLGPDADRGLASGLLGDVVVVEGWVAAWDLVTRHPEVRAVTPEGDVLTGPGILLATPDGAGPAALEASAVMLETAEHDVARSESRMVTTRREFDRVRDRERVELEALEAVEARIAGHTEALSLNERAQSETAAELSRLEARREALAAAAATRNDRIAALRLRVDELDDRTRANKDTWEALELRRSEVARGRDAVRDERDAAAAELAAVRERHRLIQERSEQAAGAARELALQPADPGSAEALRTIEEASRSALAAVRAHIETLRERQRTLRAEAGTADRALEDAHRSRTELSSTVAGARDRSSTLAIELAELRVRDESTAEMLRRDADATEDEALAASPPDLEEGEVAQEVLATLEAQLRRMGPINPLAAAEYRELADHVAEVEAQLADLEESRAELRKVISALDDEMAELFLRAFEEISVLYEENFGLVFPGGRGKLRLTDPARPLETGVEIDAQPLGKKIGRLSLLSGGERSLAALAFLFAVFRARPSPFYVLDEVEAALDDANLRRFLRLVDTLRHAAQLVIITHQQQTMEAADILYGVTMEPGDSSKVIAKRLDRVVV